MTKPQIAELTKTHNAMIHNLQAAIDVVKQEYQRKVCAALGLVEGKTVIEVEGVQHLFTRIEVTNRNAVWIHARRRKESGEFMPFSVNVYDKPFTIVMDC